MPPTSVTPTLTKLTTSQDIGSMAQIMNPIGYICNYNRSKLKNLE